MDPMTEKLPSKTGGDINMADPSEFPFLVALSNGKNDPSLIPSITSPPVRSEIFPRYNLAQLLSYGWGLLFLLVVFMAAEYFPFQSLKRGVDDFTVSAGRGAMIAVNNVRHGGEIVGVGLVRVASNGPTDGLSYLKKSAATPAVPLSKGIIASVTAVRKISQDFSLTLAGSEIELVSGTLAGGRLMAKDFLSFTALGADYFENGIMAAASSVLAAFEQSNKRIVVIDNSVKNKLSKLSIDENKDQPVSIMAKLAAAHKKTGQQAAVAQLPQRPLEGDLVKPALKSGSDLWWQHFLRPKFMMLTLYSYNDLAGPVRRTLNLGFYRTTRAGGNLSRGVYLAWNGFFDRLSSLAGGDNPVPDQTKQPAALATDGVNVVNSSEAAMFDGSGIVLLKPSGSTTLDLKNVKKLQDAFSDRVIVDFDQDGQTGMIKPIFRDRVGTEFIFVITPVKQ